MGDNMDSYGSEAHTIYVGENKMLYVELEESGYPFGSGIAGDLSDGMLDEIAANESEEMMITIIDTATNMIAGYAKGQAASGAKLYNTLILHAYSDEAQSPGTLSLYGMFSQSDSVSGTRFITKVEFNILVE